MATRYDIITGRDPALPGGEVIYRESFTYEDYERITRDWQKYPGLQIECGVPHEIKPGSLFIDKETNIPLGIVLSNEYREGSNYVKVLRTYDPV